ncbi:AAA domain-containing protein [Rhizophagus diaphanus]|nr:AAA domain-containing protein [Rhizophagus diaphanus] [Rhizophagus sp. MUCL 43196]
MNFPMSCDAGLDDRKLSFQYVILPFLGLLTKTDITKCILKHVDAIFMLIYKNLDSFFHKKVMKMLETLVSRNSIVDINVDVDKLFKTEQYSFIPPSLGIFFLIIVRLLTELLRRIKEASTNETMHNIVRYLQDLTAKYKRSLERPLISRDPLIDNLEIRKYFFAILDNEMNIMIETINTEHISETSNVPDESSNDDEKSHDNDFENISKISIIPTEEEILCDQAPYLPSLFDERHTLLNGAAKLLDRQFRLLREDMLNPIRGGISNFLTLLSKNYYFTLNNNGRLSNELENVLNRGGKYTYNKGANDNGDLQVYANIEFANVGCDRWNGLFCTLKFIPTHNSTNIKKIREYWRNSKRLKPGNLVALLLPNPKSERDFNLYSIYFGVIMSRDDMTEDERIRIHINFNDLSIYPIALNEISKLRNSTTKNNSKNSNEVKIYMVESTNIYYEAYRHVLTTLQTTKPSSLPFKQYLAPELDFCSESTHVNVVNVNPPKYTRAPGFQFDLSALCDNKQNLTLNVANKHTYDDVAKKINAYSRLDESQAKALISALTREIALIEVRLGTRTKSEKIKNFMLENIEQEVQDIKIYYKSRIMWNDVSEYLKDTHRDFYNKFSNVTHIDLPSWVLGENIIEEIDEDSETEDLQESSDEEIDDEEIDDEVTDDEETDDKGFQDYSNKEKTEESQNEFIKVQGRKMHEFEKWLIGEDIKKIEERKDHWLNNEETDSDDDEFINEELQFAKNYEKPNTDRSLNELLEDCSIWKMSKKERQKLHDYWRAKLDEERLFDLQTMHERRRQELNDIYDEERRQILLNSDVIGMTTSGAAKLQNLIKYVDPKIIICEEAGEVLEAHILSALTPSTQHLILIGDHNQLRPSVSTYSLSMESQIGENYQLNKSLFERFVDGNNAITIERTRLLTQRRMRNEISELIRRTIYDDLEDGENTAKYPNIYGAQHNVYFIDHNHPEDSFGDSGTQSHVNMHEVKMVVEMVKYFVKNGYTKHEDIAVLTPYSGQLIKIKDALSKSFSVEIDERDAENIADMEGEESNTSKPLNQRVILRTVDNFQGEEAKIVIISLVRNCSGNKYSSIGFLKSKNRSNVLLSRAKEGMYLIGNSKLMASKSLDMWAKVVDNLHKRDPSQIGPGMPIVCKLHPDCKEVVTKPEQFAEFCSPNGGCRSICNKLLSCKHTCVDKCHFNDRDHKKYKCRKPCERFKCGHKCPKYCYEDCGKCNAPVENVRLPCGHALPKVECWRVQDNVMPKCRFSIDEIILNCKHPLQNVECWRVQNDDLPKCESLIDTRLPGCEHKKDVECWRVQNNDLPKCESLVNTKLSGCKHKKDVECWKVQNDDLPKCESLINTSLPDCEHKKDVECWKVQNNDLPKCESLVDIPLLCGHTLYSAECWRKQNKEKIECNEPIVLELPCGHTLPKAKCCLDKDKENIKCKTSIEVPLPCGHTLPDVECWKNKHRQLPKCRASTVIKLPCGHELQNVECHKNEIKEEIKCTAPDDIQLPCGHILENAECWQNKNKEKIKCNATKDITLPVCGHLLQNVECYRVQNEESFTCKFPVDIKSPGCDHTLKIECCKKDQSENIPKCNHLVKTKLPCGHMSGYVDCWEIKEKEIKCSASIDIKLRCGHTLLNVKCSEKEIPKCNVNVEFEFPCGHKLKNVECWRKESLKCTEKIPKKLSCCEHTIITQCSESVDNIPCKNKCGKQLRCGHECLNKCLGCQRRSMPQNFIKDKKLKIKEAILIRRTRHQKCKFTCKNLLYCGHMCKQDCHTGECRSCNDKCAVSCEHTKKACNKECSEPCAVCAKQCSWECKHKGKCELSCGIPCDRLPCNVRCDKKLRCGHTCAGVCGEICPPCADAKCAPKEVKNQVSDRINKTTFSKVDWNKERMIFLSCGHIYTMKSMDEHMGMKDYYEGSIDGGWTSVKLLPTSTSVKACPECQTPIKDIKRYGRIIKKCTLDIQNRKFITKYDDELRKITKRINTIFNEMNKSRNKLKNELPNNLILKPKEIVLKEHNVAYKGLSEITPYYYFESIALYHGFDDNSQQVWLSHVGKLLKYYEELINIIRSTKKPPHKKAFEASLNINGGSKAFLSRLDNKIHLIYLDAILEIIKIQKFLQNEVSFIIKEISIKESITVGTNDGISIKEVWQNFDRRLKDSIQKHQCHGIDNINNTMRSPNYNNVEEEFKNSISNRLDKLWNDSD